MADPLSFRVAYGSCTWPHGSTRIMTYALTVSSDGQPKRVFPNSVMKPQGKPTVQNAGVMGDHGLWNFASFEHQEGALLLVQLSTTKNGRSWCDAATVMRLRSEAPLIQIRGNTIVAHGNMMKAVNCFHGRADILTPKEANQFKAGLTLNYIEKFLVDRSQIGEAFQQVQLLDALSGKPKIIKKTVAGREHVIVENSRKARKIRLR